MKSKMKKHRILVLGVTGMLGHKLYQALGQSFDTYGVMRGKFKDYERFKIFNRKKIIDSLDVTDTEKLRKAISSIKPNVVINAIGVVKQVCHEPIAAIKLNSLFPHELAQICTDSRARLIHISTDCVFSGKKGNYSEDDFPDADDLYGRTKLLGEVTYGNHLTIRTSIIGRELMTGHGLVEWFLSQHGKVSGYTKAIFTGLATHELARIIGQIIARPEIKGLLHIGTEKIDKLSFLQIVKKEYKKDIMIVPYDKFHCDRSLNTLKMKELGLIAKGYEAMVKEMVMERY